MIRLPSSALVTPGLVMVAIRRLPWIDQFLLVQESEDEFQLLLVPSQPVDKPALTDLESSIQQALGEPVHVRAEVVDSIEKTGHEAVTFVSKLPAAEVGAGRETGSW